MLSLFYVGILLCFKGFLLLYLYGYAATQLDRLVYIKKIRKEKQYNEAASGDIPVS